eukprot:CAMPEP_0194127334 /NCGR_PEP_ID=MMETSP0150-20130528/60468_1 /TAXON_ID=122233 /ORGANISM="Chaetoceros debilis, Strain MM31A-1" /LENGTH=104 /DNA_ID=CAMNT_0038821255 /DNA_START=839 /DNA_END=1153 /DNA_ORIENTATION=-
MASDTKEHDTYDGSMTRMMDAQRNAILESILLSTCLLTSLPRDFLVNLSSLSNGLLLFRGFAPSSSRSSSSDSDEKEGLGLLLGRTPVVSSSSKSNDEGRLDLD